MEQIKCPHCQKAVYSSSFHLGGNIMCPHCDVHTPITADLLEKVCLSGDRDLTVEPSE